MGSQVNVHTRSIRAAQRNGSTGELSEIERVAAAHAKPDSPFPFLETVVKSVKDYPYAALSAMIAVAAVVISAVTVLAVSIIGGMFLMYGEMRQNTATMKENQATMAQILDKQQTIENRQIDHGNIMRAYEAANGKRIEYAVGLMSKADQRAMNEYNKANPMPPATLEEDKDNKEN